MILDEIKVIVEGMKRACNDYNVDKLFKELDVASVDEGIKLCKEKITNGQNKINLDWKGDPYVYCFTKNDELYISNDNEYPFYSKDTIKVEFENKDEEFKFLFDIITDASFIKRIEYLMN